MSALTVALHDESGDHATLTSVAVRRLAAEGRAAHAPVELLVAALKTAAAATNGVTADELSSRYGAALIELLALFFEDDTP